MLIERYGIKFSLTKRKAYAPYSLECFMKYTLVATVEIRNEYLSTSFSDRYSIDQHQKYPKHLVKVLLQRLWASMALFLKDLALSPALQEAFPAQKALAFKQETETEATD